MSKTATSRTKKPTPKHKGRRSGLRCDGRVRGLSHAAVAKKLRKLGDVVNREGYAILGCELHEIADELVEFDAKCRAAPNK